MIEKLVCKVVAYWYIESKKEENPDLETEKTNGK